MCDAAPLRDHRLVLGILSRRRQPENRPDRVRDASDGRRSKHRDGAPPWIKEKEMHIVKNEVRTENTCR